MTSESFLEYAVYLLSRGKSEQQVRNTLLKRYKEISTLDLETISSIRKEKSEYIEQLENDPAAQMQLAIKYQDLKYLNPLNRIEAHSISADRCLYGYIEERLSNRGTVEKVKVYNPSALNSHLRAVREEVEAIQGVNKSDVGEVLITITQAEPHPSNLEVEDESAGI